MSMVFQDFSEVFLHQFTSSKRHKTTTLSVFYVKRSKNESLRVDQNIGLELGSEGME